VRSTPVMTAVSLRVAETGAWPAVLLCAICKYKVPEAPITFDTRHWMIPIMVASAAAGLKGEIYHPYNAPDDPPGANHRQPGNNYLLEL